MNGQPDSNDAALPVAVLMRIDRVCLDFETAWKAGRTPRIEDYLGESHGAERDGLLRELLLLELDYRSRGDERPTPDEYQERFPQNGGLVSDVFEKLSTEGAGGETDPHKPAGVLHLQTLPADFGDYELLEILGEGGMGIVYRARQRGVGRVVALKIIRPDRLAGVSPERRQEMMGRFQAEIQAATRLEHEHIIPVYEVGEVAGEPFFSMRYIEGRGLDSVLREGPLDGQEAAALLEKVARAVHYAHGRQVVHRDLKPRNILLDGRRRPYVADFGLAKSLEAARELTQTGQPLGTPEYMSPEQAQGVTTVDYTTDVYSLGATLYELLTGRPPFRAATAAETQRQVIDNEPVPPRQLNAAVPRDLETICLKCLEKEPGRRYATAEALADELGRYQQGNPIHARPITRVARVWRWCKRNRAAAGLGTVAASLLLLLAIAGPMVAVREIRLRRHADYEAGRATYQANRAATLLGQKQQALNEANQQRDRAEAYLTMAMKALEEVVTRVGERDLEYVPQMESVRRQVLTDAVKFYELLLEKETSLGEETNTTALRGELARAWLRVGEINQLMGANAEAEQAYDHAVSRFANLAREFPKEPRYRFDLAKAHNGRGTVLASATRVREAEENVETAIHLVDELHKKAPDDPEYAHALGALWHQRGTLLSGYHPPNEMFDLSDRLQEAETSYSKAAELVARLVEKNPEVPRYKDALARMYRHQGERAVKKGQFAEAKTAYRQAVACMDARVRQRPYSPSLRHALATDYVGLAGALGAERQWQEAQKSCEQAISLEERNRNEYPLVPQFRNGLAAALHGNARLLISQGKPADARAMLQQAVTERLEALKSENDNPVFRGALSSDYDLLVRTLVALRDHAAAADAAVQFAQVYDKHGPSLFVATDFLVGCARLARADQALTPEKREKLAQDYLDLARQMLDGAVEDAEAHPHIPVGRWNMAFYLAEPPEPELRDAARAVRIAREVFDQLPDSCLFWFELALIHYRAGNWEESLRAVSEALARESKGNCTTWSLAAMTHWQLGNKEEARAWYSKTVARIEQTGCRNAEHHRLAREAAALLDMTAPRLNGQIAAGDESPHQPLTGLPALETSPLLKGEPKEPLP